MRRPSLTVPVGNIAVGGQNPIVIQSMASVSTMATDEAVAQAKRILDAGAGIVRYTAQGVKEAQNLAHIRAGLDIDGYTRPLVADIHFNPHAADAALDTVEKVRINPGNFVDTRNHTGDWTAKEFDRYHRLVQERFGTFVDKAKRLGRAIRIGVNHGSLSERMVQRYGDTPEGMVQSCLEFLDVCVEHEFDRIVISMKSSNTMVMTEAVRLLERRLREGGYPTYPFHLGVTEAGEGEDGRIKSAVGIGALLADGLGDTIRVSLSEEPEHEVPVAFALRDYVVQREGSTCHAADMPTAEEYLRLCAAGRQDTFVVNGLVGGGCKPCVVTHRPENDNGIPLPDFYFDGKVLAEPHGGKFITPYILDAACELSDRDVTILRNNPEIVIMLRTDGVNPVAEWRLGYARLRRKEIKQPIILCRRYRDISADEYRLFAAADAGTILLDGWANGLMLESGISDATVMETAAQLAILQASRLRMSKTEYISCPSCGRTLYDIQTTIAKIKAATSHLKGLKIGIMGCIVNGPGEMADADYGYVGGSPGTIDLYKQHKCVRRGIPEAEAVQELIALIKQNNDWHSPEN